MKNPVRIDKLAGAWFQRADKDMHLAELAAADTEPFGDLISFLAQQCAEKYLKGLMVFLQVEFPKTHDLKQLSELLHPHWPAMPFSGKEIEHLTLYAVSSRYPDQWEDVSLPEAMKAIETAKRVRKAVKAFLKERGFEKA